MIRWNKVCRARHKVCRGSPVWHGLLQVGLCLSTRRIGFEDFNPYPFGRTVGAWATAWASPARSCDRLTPLVVRATSCCGALKGAESRQVLARQPRRERGKTTKKLLEHVGLELETVSGALRLASALPRLV